MAKRFLLDTHVVIEIATAGGFEKMPAKVRSILQDPDAELLLSVVSRAEVAIKTAIGKLELGQGELDAVCDNASIFSYSLRKSHTDKLFELPVHHKDPFDRLIVSTALSDELPLISRDKHFRRYKGLRVIW